MTILCFSFTTWSQPSKIGSYAVTLVGLNCVLVNREGFHTGRFEAGGTDSPAIRADIRFKFNVTWTLEAPVQLPFEDKPRPNILMRVSLIDVDRDLVMSSMVIELGPISPDCRSIHFPIGDRSSNYELWFQDSWEENVKGMRRVVRGIPVNWDGTTVNIYASASNQDDVAPKKQTRQGYKVD